MEELNKHQLILLVLLVSFVTSIATGIVTVSLMDQAPPGMTQTINRIVEKTIERVVTEPSSQAAAVVTRETVVVKADDAIINAIDKNSGSVVRIKEATGEGHTAFAGLGLVMSRDGLVAADISVAYRKTDSLGNAIAESYQGVFPDGRIFPLNIVYSEQGAGLIFFQVLLQDREKGVYRFKTPEFGLGDLKLGQAVVALSGDDTNSVSTGIISNLVQKSVTKTPDSSTTTPQTVKELVAVKTDIRSVELVSGSVLLNLSGEVIGMNAGSLSANRNIFVPIQKVLDTALKVPTPKPAPAS
ncbi:MAG: serine protease [Candidatus Taylorbacteria bacterium]|nr:serine protease [Candidatus Taylorbacteria bacterium]